MYPRIFEAVNIPSVRAVLKNGQGPLRFYLFGRAPQNVEYPYAVWRLISGGPENYLADRPVVDNASIQIDIYSNPSQGPDEARKVSNALRDALELHAYVVSFRGEWIDPDTNNFATGFDIDWIVER